MRDIIARAVSTAYSRRSACFSRMLSVRGARERPLILEMPTRFMSDGLGTVRTSNPSCSCFFHVSNHPTSCPALFLKAVQSAVNCRRARAAGLRLLAPFPVSKNARTAAKTSFLSSFPSTLLPPRRMRRKTCMARSARMTDDMRTRSEAVHNDSRRRCPEEDEDDADA